MKPVIAQRTTKCHYCRGDIIPGAERLTDSGQVKLTKTNGEPYIRYYRNHYHFRTEEGLSCYDAYAKEKFSKLEHVVKGNNKSGRPKLPLTDTQRTRRNLLLKRLAGQVDYYIKKGNLVLDGPPSWTSITLKKAKQVERFSKNMDKIIKELKEVGGVPPHYKEYEQQEDNKES